MVETGFTVLLTEPPLQGWGGTGGVILNAVVSPYHIRSVGMRR